MKRPDGVRASPVLQIVVCVALASTAARVAGAADPPGGVTRLDLVPDQQLVTIDAAGASQRALLLALSARADFRVLHAEDVPDVPTTCRLEGVTVARAVAQLLEEAGIDYVMALRRGQPGGVRIVVVARHGVAAAGAELAALDREPDTVGAKGETPSQEQARARSQKTSEEMQEELEESLRQEGEPVPPRNDPLARPPVVVSIPDVPKPIILTETPKIQVLPLTAQPVPVPAPPVWIPVTEADVTPGAGAKPIKPPQ